jgi:hypothetical protein
MKTSKNTKDTMKTKRTTKKKKSKDDGRPRRSLNLYNIFFAIERKKILEEEARPGFGGLAREISARWKAIDDDYKKELDELVRRDRVRFEKEMKDWKLNRKEANDVHVKKKDETNVRRGQLKEADANVNVIVKAIGAYPGPTVDGQRKKANAGAYEPLPALEDEDMKKCAKMMDDISVISGQTNISSMTSTPFQPANVPALLTFHQDSLGLQDFDCEPLDYQVEPDFDTIVSTAVAESAVVGSNFTYNYSCVPCCTPSYSQFPVKAGQNKLRRFLETAHGIQVNIDRQVNAEGSDVWNSTASNELFGRRSSMPTLDHQEIGARNTFVSNHPYKTQDMLYTNSSQRRIGSSTALNEMLGRRSSMPTMASRQGMGARNSFVPNVETYPYTIGNYMTSDELFGRSDHQEIGTRNSFVRPYNQDMMYVDNSLQRTGPTALNDMFGRRSSMPTMTNRQEMGSFHQGRTMAYNVLEVLPR